MNVLEELLAFDPTALSWLDIIDLHEQAGMTMEQLGEAISEADFSTLVADPAVMRLAGVALWLTSPRVDGQRPPLRAFLGELTIEMLVDQTVPAANRADRRRNGKGKKHKPHG